MKKLLYILPFIAQYSIAQVIISRDTNTATDSSVGLEISSSNQAVALPEYNITAYNVHPYTKEPKGGAIVFSPNKNGGLNEDFYGYFYWDDDQHLWVKLLDSVSFSSDKDFSSPYFFTNYDGASNTSIGVDVLSPFSSTNNTSNTTLSSMTNSNHINGTNLNVMTSNYWTIVPAGFQPTFKFAKTADAFVKVNAMLVKPGGGTFDFSIAMGVFINDVLVANKIFPFVNLADQGYCARRKITILAPVNNIPANIDQKVKIGFRIVGNNHFNSKDQSYGNNFTLNNGKISVGLGFSNTNGSTGTYCASSSFQSPINVTVYGVTR
ncbi:hypothetical protein ACTS94_07310 [Empedobacter falsenii]